MIVGIEMDYWDIRLSTKSNQHWIMGEGRIGSVASYSKTTGKYPKFSFQSQGVFATIEKTCIRRFGPILFIKYQWKLDVLLPARDKSLKEKRTQRRKLPFNMWKPTHKFMKQLTTSWLHINHNVCLLVCRRWWVFCKNDSARGWTGDLARVRRTW